MRKCFDKKQKHYRTQVVLVVWSLLGALWTEERQRACSVGDKRRQLILVVIDYWGSDVRCEGVNVKWI